MSQELYDQGFGLGQGDFRVTGFKVYSLGGSDASLQAEDCAWLKMRAALKGLGD